YGNQHLLVGESEQFAGQGQVERSFCRQYPLPEEYPPYLNLASIGQRINLFGLQNNWNQLNPSPLPQRTLFDKSFHVFPWLKFWQSPIIPLLQMHYPGHLEHKHWHYHNGLPGG